VQGYDNGLAALWGNDAAAFNARNRDRTDINWDLTALVRHVPNRWLALDLGFARKSHSPNLYERYPWATNAMAALMNNFLGDGNGYVGNANLKPEIAHTLSASLDVHDAASEERWQLKVRGYYTFVENYIDARRCDFGQCSSTNSSAQNAFVILQYVNQNAHLYGGEISAKLRLWKSDSLGTASLKLVSSYVRGVNESTGVGLYHMMPLNGSLSFLYRLGAWESSVEAVGVANKDYVSSVRNEAPTAAYGLVNLHSAYEWKNVRIGLGVENLFNAFYANPLGGAYVGQGPSMTTSGIAWGTTVPGRGRSINLEITVRT
jgi:iron complex outermembrane receptor protein